jgi:hypothetical protein
VRFVVLSGGIVRKANDASVEGSLFVSSGTGAARHSQRGRHDPRRECLASFISLPAAPECFDSVAPALRASATALRMTVWICDANLREAKTALTDPEAGL